MQCKKQECLLIYMLLKIYTPSESISYNVSWWQIFKAWFTGTIWTVIDCRIGNYTNIHLVFSFLFLKKWNWFIFIILINKLVKSGLKQISPVWIHVHISWCTLKKPPHIWLKYDFLCHVYYSDTQNKWCLHLLFDF